jgi:hypothetical protein
MRPLRRYFFEVSMDILYLYNGHVSEGEKMFLNKIKANKCLMDML